MSHTGAEMPNTEGISMIGNRIIRMIRIIIHQ